MGIQGCSLSLDTTSISVKPYILQIFLHHFYREHKSLGEVSKTKKEIHIFKLLWPPQKSIKSSR